MFPSELEIRMRRQELQRAAEHYTLIQSLRENQPQPTLWQRVRAYLIGTAELPSQAPCAADPLPRAIRAEVIALSR